MRRFLPSEFKPVYFKRSSPSLAVAQRIVVHCLAVMLHGLAILACNTGTSTPVVPVTVGQASTYGVGYLGFVPGNPILIGRDSGGYYAMSSYCTFDDWDLSTSGTLNDQGLSCDQCDSLYDRLGVVKRGPASRILAHFQVVIDATGNLVVHPEVEVAIAARTAPQ